MGAREAFQMFTASVKEYLNIDDSFSYMTLFNLEHPVGFVFTVGLTVAAILMVKAMFEALYLSRDEEERQKTLAKARALEAEREKIVQRDFTVEQLNEFNGLNDKPIYIGINREVFDASEARDTFYGPGKT